MIRIIEDKNKNCEGQIFNIGQPENELTIAEMAEKMCDIFDEHFRQEGDPPRPEIVSISGEEFYGPGYEDCDRRIADITKARTLLDWEPQHDLDSVITHTMKYFVDEFRKKQAAGVVDA